MFPIALLFATTLFLSSIPATLALALAKRPPCSHRRQSGSLIRGDSLVIQRAADEVEAGTLASPSRTSSYLAPVAWEALTNSAWLLTLNLKVKSAA